MTGVFDPLTAVLGIPVLAAALLVALPGYRLTATLNVVATFLTLLAAISLFFGRPQPSAYLLVDDLNNVFIVLTTFVGFTTSVFSASYIGHELEILLGPPCRVRLRDIIRQGQRRPESSRNVGFLIAQDATEFLSEPRGRGTQLLTNRSNVSDFVGEQLLGQRIDE